MAPEVVQHGIRLQPLFADFLGPLVSRKARGRKARGGRGFQGLQGAPIQELQEFQQLQVQSQHPKAEVVKTYQLLSGQTRKLAAAMEGEPER